MDRLGRSRPRFPGSVASGALQRTTTNAGARCWNVYANRTDDVEWLPPVPDTIAKFLPPRSESTETESVQCPGWPFDSEEATRRQQAIGLPTAVTVAVADELPLEFVLIPAGEFVMGDPNGAPDERLPARLRIDTPFYMSRCEITNAQFAALSGPDHFSGHVAWRSIDWRGEGYPLSGPDQPAVRVFMAGSHGVLPGSVGTSGQTGHSSHRSAVGMGVPCRPRHTVSGLAVTTMISRHSRTSPAASSRSLPSAAKRKWYLRDDRSDDGSMITAAVGFLPPQSLGITRYGGEMSANGLGRPTVPYPYALDDGRDEPTAEVEKVCPRRFPGTSARSRPAAGRRWKYPSWRKVFNVGFRVIMPVER